MVTLRQSIHAIEAWKQLYDVTRRAIHARSPRPWDFSVSPIFAHIDAFLQRCNDLLEVCSPPACHAFCCSLAFQGATLPSPPSACCHRRSRSCTNRHHGTRVKTSNPYPHPNPKHAFSLLRALVRARTCVCVCDLVCQQATLASRPPPPGARTRAGVRVAAAVCSLTHSCLLCCGVESVKEQTSWHAVHLVHTPSQVCEAQLQFAPRSPLPAFGGTKGPEVRKSILDIHATFKKLVSSLKNLKYNVLDVKATQ